MKKECPKDLLELSQPAAKASMEKYFLKNQISILTLNTKK